MPVSRPSARANPPRGPRLVERVRAAAFDLDGTLLDTAPDLAAAANATLTALGRVPLPQARIERLIGGGIERLVAGLLAETDPRQPEPAAVAQATELFRWHYAERLFGSTRVYPGVVEGLRALAALGVALCCVTNKASAFTGPLLEAAGLADFFAFALCADRAEHRKPAPDLLLAACARFAVAPRQLLCVGDSRADIAAARAAGCPVAAVDYGYSQGVSLADEAPDWIVGSVADLLSLPAGRLHADTEA